MGFLGSFGNPFGEICSFLSGLVFDTILWYALVLLEESGFSRCVFISWSLGFICEFRCQGETFYIPPFLYILFFLTYFFAGLFIRRKHLFYLMSGGDFLIIPPFLYIWIIILAPRGFYYYFFLPNFMELFPHFNPGILLSSAQCLHKGTRNREVHCIQRRHCGVLP